MGKPAVKYQHPKYSVAQMMRYGISEMVCAPMKALQWYVLDWEKSQPPRSSHA
jgi:hypothetical protein